MRIPSKRGNLKLLKGDAKLSDEQAIEDLADSGSISDDDEQSPDFDSAVAHYYRQKSIEHDLTSAAALNPDAVDSEELAHRVLTMYAYEPRHVLVKMNILENELATDMDLTSPVDRRHLLMFAALKADIILLLAEVA